MLSFLQLPSSKLAIFSPRKIWKVSYRLGWDCGRVCWKTSCRIEVELGFEVVWGNASRNPGARYLYVPLWLWLWLLLEDMRIFAYTLHGVFGVKEFTTLPVWCLVSFSLWDSSGGLQGGDLIFPIISYGSLRFCKKFSTSFVTPSSWTPPSLPKFFQPWQCWMLSFQHPHLPGTIARSQQFQRKIIGSLGDFMKKTLLFRSYRGLYYPVNMGILISHYRGPYSVNCFFLWLIYCCESWGCVWRWSPIPKHQVWSVKRGI